MLELATPQDPESKALSRIWSATLVAIPFWKAIVHLWFLCIPKTKWFESGTDHPPFFCSAGPSKYQPDRYSALPCYMLSPRSKKVEHADSCQSTASGSCFNRSSSSESDESGDTSLKPAPHRLELRSTQGKLSVDPGSAAAASQQPWSRLASDANDLFSRCGQRPFWIWECLQKIVED